MDFWTAFAIVGGVFWAGFFIFHIIRILSDRNKTTYRYRYRMR